MIGIAFLMTLKPSLIVSIVVVVTAAAIGLLASVVAAERDGLGSEAKSASQENRERGKAS